MSHTPAFLPKETIAELAANMLLEVEAVRFYDGDPFQTTSGWATPVYTDCRKLISYPRIRDTLMDMLTATILRDIGFESLDGIAGGETAGIPFAAWISDRMALPMQYVRKKPKGFGRKAQIEGDFAEGDHILLVEDMTTDGQSKITFCNALRAAGAVCNHTAVVFYYDIFPHSQRIFSENNITLHHLTTWWDVLKAAKAKNAYDTATLAEVEKFLNDPINWSGAHGGLAEYPD